MKKTGKTVSLKKAFRFELQSARVKKSDKKS